MDIGAGPGSGFLQILPILTEVANFIIHFILLNFLYRAVSISSRSRYFYYLTVIIVTSMVTNLSILFFFLKQTPGASASLILFSRTLRRVEAGTLLMQFLFIFYLFRDLSSKKCTNMLCRFYRVFSWPFIIAYWGWALYGFIFQYADSVFIDEVLIKLLSTYVIVQGAHILFIAYRNGRLEKLKLLRKYNTTMGWYFMFPYCVFKLIETDFITSDRYSVFAAPITSALLTLMVCYCAYRLVGLRFFNIEDQVVTPRGTKHLGSDFDFSSIEAEFKLLDDPRRLFSINRKFFYELLQVSGEKVHLFFQDLDVFPRDAGIGGLYDKRYEYVSTMLAETVERAGDVMPHESIGAFLKSHRLIVRDEVELTHFYEQIPQRKEKLRHIIAFMDQIKADIFLPIFVNNSVIAYIIVDQDARPDDLYGSETQREMIFFSHRMGLEIDVLKIMKQKRTEEE